MGYKKLNTYRNQSIIIQSMHIYIYTLINKISIEYQTAEAITSCWVFLSGARGGSPSSAALSIPPAKTTNIVDSQQDIGCLREKASAPTNKYITNELDQWDRYNKWIDCYYICTLPGPRSSRTWSAQSTLWATSKYGYIFNFVTWLANSKNDSASIFPVNIIPRRFWCLCESKSGWRWRTWLFRSPSKKRCRPQANVCRWTA